MYIDGDNSFHSSLTKASEVSIEGLPEAPTLHELHDALMSMENRKSPGIAG